LSPSRRESSEDCLVSRNIDIYESQDRQRSDSFASSFPHFANKLISSVPQAAESTDSFQTDSASRYHQQQQQVQEHNRLRAAASTPDIKALFDSPNAPQGLFYPSNPPPPPPAVSTMASASNSPLTNSSIYTSPYQDGSATAALGGGDVWGAPKFFQRGATGSTSSTGPGIVFPPSRTTRLSDDANSLHRPAPEATANMDESMKALRKPRSFSHRTQSLDIGALAAQQVIQQAISASPAMGSMDHSLRASGTPANSSPNFSTSQRPFGAIGSTPSYAMGSSTGISMAANHHLSRGASSSNDFTSNTPIHPFAATTTPRLQHHQQYPSQQYTTLPHQHQQHYQNHHHHHHVPTPSISRLAPSAIQHAPEPETADEVLRSLAQLHFPASSS
jgi:hypothetical protein